MKRMLAWLMALPVMTCPVLAEDADRQAEANAAYARVLLEGAAFMPMEDDVRMQQEWKPVRFTVLDLDGDSLTEVILELAEPEGFIVLTCAHDGHVYGAEVVYRGMLALKDDGTSSFSSGAADNGVAEMCFVVDQDTGLPIGIGRYILAESVSDENGDILYYLDGGAQQTDEAGYLAFLAEQEAKLNALWYDYTEENVKMLLGQ